MNTLDCNRCGEAVFTEDDEGMFQEDQHAWCPGCGVACVVVVEDQGAEGIGVAGVLTHDERVIDVGQPKCDGSCGAIAEYQGIPCTLDCARCSDADRNELRDATTDGDTP